MTEKRKSIRHEPYGLLGKTFQYTRDDLNANRAGYMTLAQQIGFNFLERKLFSGLLTMPPLKWVLGSKRRKIFKITGKVKKYQSVRFIDSGSSGGDGGGYSQVLQTKSIEFLARDETVTFYVDDKQYNSLPENIEMTLYYDKHDYQIVSVEPPYAED